MPLHQYNHNATLIHACQYNKLELIKECLDAGANINTSNGLPLCWAAYNGNLEIVKYLVERGAEVTTKVIDYAQWNKHYNIVDHFVLKDKMPKLSSSDIEKAIESNDIKFIKKLLAAGFNIHNQSDWLLRVAVTKNRVRVVRFLLENGADITVCDNFPLELACYNGHKRMTRLLIEKGANLNKYSLRKVIRNKNYNLLPLLIERDEDYYYLLNQSIFIKDKKAIRLLIDLKLGSNYRFFLDRPHDNLVERIERIIVFRNNRAGKVEINFIE